MFLGLFVCVGFFGQCQEEFFRAELARKESELLLLRREIMTLREELSRRDEMIKTRDSMMLNSQTLLERTAILKGQNRTFAALDPSACTCHAKVFVPHHFTTFTDTVLVDQRELQDV
eukprot:c5669_g1_i1.p2 GENE.c5669_g1_i1~~c5669_g1_i1.p2  ORF type:complete len:117 (-),score=15.42 c5669_g1_i1:234-584(-)